MVTTRSADKRGAAEGKVEDLALRSRATDIESASQLESSPTPSKSVKKRTKIIVNIPIALEKKPDLSESTEDDASYATAKDTLGSARDIDLQFAEAARSFDSSGVATRIEIPDSQETAATPKKDISASSQDFVSSTNDAIQSTPVSARTRRTKRKLDVQSTPTNQPGEGIDVTPEAKAESQHRRFGSKDSIDSDIVVVATQSDQETRDQTVDDSDGNDGPEVSSTRRTVNQKSSTRGNKRRKATQPSEAPTEFPKVPLAPTPTISAHSAESDTTIQPQEGIPIAMDRSFSDTTTITPTHEAMQTLPLRTTMLEFRSSNNDLHRTRNPDQMGLEETTTAPTAIDDTVSNIQNRQPDLNIQHIRRHKNSQPASTNKPNSLPPKASNTIEKYRRNKMASRRNHRPESDWSMKRSRFVVA